MQRRRSLTKRRKTLKLSETRTRGLAAQELEERQMLSITVEDFGLANDTGSSATDQVTSDATLTGEAVCVGYNGELLIQFDLDNDGTADDQRMTTGEFEYRPFGLAYGSHTVQARAGVWDDVESTFVFGNWAQVSFTLERYPAPTIATLALVNDTGESSTKARM